MKPSTSRVKGDEEKSVRLGFTWSLIVLVILWLMVGVFSWQLPPQIPLFYSQPFGKTQLADRGWFLILPAMASIVYTVNLFMVRLQKKIMVVYRQLAAWTTFLIIFLTAVAMANIVILVL